MTSVLRRRLTAFLAAAAVLSTIGACASSPGTSPGASGACPTSQPQALAAGETRTVTMATEKGTIVIKLEADLSPIAVGNFAALVGCGYYDGVVFHRVVPGFVVQGGDGQYGKKSALNLALEGTGGPGYTIKDEPVTVQYGRGTVAMARSDQPDSVGSQFFIVVDDAAQGALGSYNTYQIIGTVTSGMEVADAIVDAAAGVEIPKAPVAMTSVTIANP